MSKIPQILGDPSSAVIHAIWIKGIAIVIQQLPCFHPRVTFTEKKENNIKKKIRIIFTKKIKNIKKIMKRKNDGKRDDSSKMGRRGLPTMNRFDVSHGKMIAIEERLSLSPSKT